MPTPQDLEAKLWKALRSDRTVMLGLDDGQDGLRPMTVQADSDDENRGPLWVFTAKDNGMVQQLDGTEPAIASFVDKGHDLFATIRGSVTLDDDPATIERLWNPFIAAWYEGKDDPKLALVRFDLLEAEIWLNENSMFAGLKMMLGVDPKEDYEDKVAEVRLR